MTEAEWLACENPAALLGGLRQLAREARGLLSCRKLILFAVANYHELIADSPSPFPEEVAHAAEAFAEGNGDYRRIHQLWESADHAARIRGVGVSPMPHPSDLSAYAMICDLLSVSTPGITEEMRVTRAKNAAARLNKAMRARGTPGIVGARRKQAERAADRLLANTFREVFGNPFCLALVARPAATQSLAQAAYENRHLPGGHLDNARLLVLSDALEEAGCTDDAILSHLRSPGPHVRGCWALDLILSHCS